MKRIIWLFPLAVILFTASLVMDKNNLNATQDNSQVEKLWKDYQAARNSDRPQKQLDILDEIKQTARKERLPWDFYRAGEEYVSVSVSRNWKLRDSLNRQFQKEIADFDEPILTFYNTRNNVNGKADFLKKNRQKLESGHNTGFYNADGNLSGEVFSPILKDLIANDWQYALWSLVLANRWTPGSVEEIADLLAETLGDKYPDAAILEFARITRRDEFRAKEQLEEYARKYDGKAVALMARQSLLSKEFSKLLVDEAPSADFRALREKCTAFEKDRKAFSGSEKKIADCCDDIENLIEDLDGKDISFSVEDGLLTASLKNLNGITVTVKDEEGKNKVWSTRLDNPARNYYVRDTVKVQLPAFDDGLYNIECSEGKVSTDLQYRRYGLSLAQREDAHGYAVYVAHAKSGEPVHKVDITLTDNTKKGQVLAELKDFALGEGYTYLPKDFTDKFFEDRWKNRLTISMKDTDGTTRKVLESGLATSGTQKRTLDDRTYASIFVDRSVFNPGETAKFKVVVYHGDKSESLATLEGKKLTVKLFDTEGKEIASQNIQTNEFGSAAGEFFLERQERGGMFRITVEDGGRNLASASIRVDDIILPTFDLTFDPDPNLYFPGDSISVRGTLKSYSGHSLAAADIRYTVTQGGDVVSEGVLHPDRNGRFTISFKSGQDRYLYYNVHVGVSDATGETLEWNTGRQIQRSIPFSATLENRTEADLRMKDDHDWRDGEYYQSGVVSGDLIRLSLHTDRSYQGTDKNRKSLRINYTLKSGNKVLAEGKAAPGDVLEFNTAGSPSGLYVFEAVATDKDVFGNEVKSSVYFDIIKVKEGDTSLDADVKNLFIATEGDGFVTVTFGTTDGPVWAVLEMFGTGNVRLGTKSIHLDGKRGKKGSLETVRFDWPEGAPDAIKVNLLYFKDYSRFSFSEDFSRAEKKLALPLAFTRFLDKTSPGTAYSFEIATKPGVECVATIFDKSTETIQANRWNRVYLSGPEGPSVYVQTVLGSDRTDYRVMVRAAGAGGVLYKTASNEMMLESAAAPAPMPESMDMERSLNETVKTGYDSMDDSISLEEEMGADISVRENFAKTIAFEPFLRSDASGKINFDFTTADKLSTFIVQLFAHDKGMDNAILRQEMTVTVPAKVSLVEPLYLYEGDRYFVKASLSSSVDETLAGRLRIDLYDGKDYRNSAPIRSTVKPVKLEPMGALSEDLEIEVPEGIGELGVKVTFIADSEDYGSDAVFVSVPVYKAVQTLTEAHSSILHSGESMESLLARLKGEFVNTSGEDATQRIISLLDMVKEALPSKVEPASDNVMDLSEALYVRLLATKLGSKLTTERTSRDILDKLLACHNHDGGFAWFKDMDSSPIITATLLDRYAGLRRRGLDVSAIPADVIESSVKYLDKVYFNDNKRPFWCGGISEEQYVSVRVQFPEVEFSTKGMDNKQLRSFRKRMKEYLTPRKERGLNGYILGKARRMRALMSLSGSDEGRRLAADWGIRLGTTAKLRNSLIKDLASILEYAVSHKSGGWYYPNAVMPFRGLMESEAYAHAFIADLLRDCAVTTDGKSGSAEARSIAEGISLWLMVQKETQQWDEDAAFVDAISSVLDASQETLDTKVVSLTKTFTKPFVEVKAYGNGFTVERRFFVERTVDGKLSRTSLAEGDMLAIGDKVFAEYHIWNEENRSFVKLTAPRPASLRPANQLSGQYGWWLRPLSIAGWHTFSPHGYRSVISDRTEYWFDAYPEENTTITEEFLVTQAGSFQTPAVSIESLYAPHYRAADNGRGPLLSR